ncbi:saxitoxin and tetrodotoxin-binding protein 2-like [Epinephelus fuscoguttatus]|uniref:saxitoxin and tetrodotoxin-binding protein 2-like n=1 Tax=Epinephelus fuscoguttatus TaxID=293821 RepID=UPI0020D12A84|nr:saxitoxin and tetrodotoxin-binding protein 2-like [Epinephelus fuscoguttatus]
MSVVKQATLLLLLAVISTYADHHHDCHGLTKKLPETDLHKIFGDWVLVWSISKHEKAPGLWSDLTSSHVELRLLPDNHTITFTERNMFHNAYCINYFINMTTDESHNYTLQIIGGTMEINGTISPDNELGHLGFYESCPDCLVFVWRGEDHCLMIYKKDGEHRDAELLKAARSNHTKLAECLGFPHDKAFHYDGAADFCHKKSSPDEVEHEG